MEKPLELVLNEFKRDILSLINAKEYKSIPLIIKQMCFNEIKTTLDDVVNKMTNDVMKEYLTKQELLKKQEDEVQEKEDKN